MNTYFDPSILPVGYTVWKGAPDNNFDSQTLIAVSGVYGPGYNQTAQENGNITIVLDRKEVAPFARPIDVFMTPEGRQSSMGWLDPVAARTRRS
ncbi:uncharacterized protein ACLA_059980 [Aspergillus clavatus NRRL 1]|uniref:Uncharacterized protein n=1 Tax=Aspergillus clavatus (strain ATCC 1007 / CBS 513.65 / DSM 816 / NCTC 3887 / NRRL 1 / QM 1276 / 107) TaxID=344612 RepID=A1C4J1_ASPCL|nr:uncharacterized protein ACLA_059980 [Aspergillus clavatus NRRL 1]EAW15331.1 hypothetical protein ACLA_059980 [Aspergillus clavatus NRRL 1]